MQPAKDEIIVIRVSEDDKAELQSAASKAGHSLTNFMLDASKSAAQRLKGQPEVRGGVHTGVASWFRATCRTAAAGGAAGYEMAGFSLTGKLHSEMPLDVEEDEWAETIAKLESLLEADDDIAVLGWFESRYPRFMQLVPMRRRAQFLEGVRRAYREGEIEN